LCKGGKKKEKRKKKGREKRRVGPRTFLPVLASAADGCDEGEKGKERTGADGPRRYNEKFGATSEDSCWSPSPGQKNRKKKKKRGKKKKEGGSTSRALVGRPLPFNDGGVARVGKKERKKKREGREGVDQFNHDHRRDSLTLFPRFAWAEEGGEEGKEKGERVKPVCEVFWLWVSVVVVRRGFRRRRGEKKEKEGRRRTREERNRRGVRKRRGPQKKGGEKEGGTVVPPRGGAVLLEVVNCRRKGGEERGIHSLCDFGSHVRPLIFR